MSKANEVGELKTQKNNNKKGAKKQMNIIEQHQKAQKVEKEIQPLLVCATSATGVRNRCKF